MPGPAPKPLEKVRLPTTVAILPKTKELLAQEALRRDTSVSHVAAEILEAEVARWRNDLVRNRE